MFHYKSYADLSSDIAHNLQKLPEVDLVIGIPKSGMIPATMIASFINKHLIDLDSFMFSYALRSGVRKYGPKQDEKLRILVVDDSINTGHEMRRVRERLSAFKDEFTFHFAAVYGVEEGAHGDVADVVLDHVPQPRFFQWNYRNHIVAENALFDMDGVLCIDPTDEDNDDGERYAKFLLNAQPLTIPRKTLSAIVTSRIERWRPQTEEWLKANGVSYKELIMLDLPSGEERRRLRAHAPFKAEVYRSRPEMLFVESNWKQAKQIAEMADKPVICTENDILLMGGKHLADLSAVGFDRMARAENGQLNLLLQKSLNRLFEIDPQAGDFLAQVGYSHSRQKKSEPNAWYRNKAVHQSLRPKIRAGDPLTRLKGKLRLVMLSTTLDVRRGAGAATSTGRLVEALRADGHHVEVLTLEDFPHKPYVDQPIKGTHGSYWNSLHDPVHSKLLHEKLREIAPDCIILGAVDRGLLSPLDIALLSYPIIWISRDNWGHTGGCLFKLPAKEVGTAPQPIDQKVVAAMTCDGYMSGCKNCPIFVDPRENSKAQLQYKLKEMVYAYRQDIVFGPISSWMYDMLKSAPLTQAHTINLCRNPIDTENLPAPLSEAERKAARAEFGLPETGPVVLLGAHSLKNPRKGVKLAIEAIRLNEALRSKVHFVIMGDDVNRDDYADLNVKTTGFLLSQELKWKLYQCVDATLVPALQESLSVVASDSVCAGVPVVAFRTSGLASFLQHFNTGYLARAFDVEDLARGIVWTLFQADQEVLRRNCLAVSKTQFDAKANAIEVLKAVEAAREAHKSLAPLPAEIAVAAQLLGQMSPDIEYRHSEIRHARKKLAKTNEKDAKNNDLTKNISAAEEKFFEIGKESA